MGNSNSVVTKYNFEDEPLINNNNNNNNKLKHQTDQTKPTSDYEVLFCSFMEKNLINKKGI
jgi:hypothetical protein